MPIPQLNSSVPPAFIGIVRKMMTRAPDQRFAAAAEVRERLLPWADGESTQPLDRQGDREYQEAIIALEHAEPPPEVMSDVLPVGIPVTSEPKTPSPVPTNPVRRIRSPLEPPEPFWEHYQSVFIGLGVLLLLTVGLAFLLIWLLGR
jgi:hypothetical protein